MVSFFVGKVLILFLLEWLLGFLGVLLIWFVFYDDDDDIVDWVGGLLVINVLVIYLVVCVGCNLLIFLFVFVGESMVYFVMILGFIGILMMFVVFIIN